MPVSLSPHSQHRKFLVSAFGQDTGQSIFDLAEAIPEAGREQFFIELSDTLSTVVKGGDTPLSLQYRFKPVDIETFVRDPFYLGLDKEIYPEVMPFLTEMNSGQYVEVVLTGGIGSAKTTLALWTNAYQLYLLSVMRNPHSVFGLDYSSEIEIVFQNLTAKLAEDLDYARFKELINRSPYFQKYFPHDRSLKSELHFPHRIIVKPVSGSNLATIGQNVIGGLIDELNYMAVVDRSKKSVDAGVYNQAVEVYNSIARRRKSRYMKQGKLPGILCLVSSKKYPGQFTDTKIEEAQNDPTIYVYDKRVWEIKPDSFSKKRFRVFVGDEFRKPRILGPKETLEKADQENVVGVPEDFKVDFQKDIVNALREIAGISHLSKAPFFTDSDALFKIFTKRKSIFSQDDVDFDRRNLEIIKSAIKNKDFPRFVHVDLALTGDSAGIALGYVSGFKKVNRGPGMAETLPSITIDGVLRVSPPVNGEIPFARIRKILYVLKALGLNIRWVTYDSFQSADSMQILRQKGFIVGYQSMDTTMAGYDFTKSAIYDGRLDVPEHIILRREMKDLQINFKKHKVDHLPTGSKDCSDALAGVVYGLTLRREVWGQFGIPVSEIPQAIIEAVKKDDKKAQRGKTPSNSMAGEE